MKLCFIDTETTGLDTTKHAVCQVAGIITFDGNTSRQIEHEFSFNLEPFPGDLVSLEALTINKMTMNQLHSFEDPIKIYGALKNLFTTYCDPYNKLDKMFFIAYNGAFDYNFMRRYWEKCNDKYFGSFFWFPYIDIMQMAIRKLMSKRHEMKDFKLSTVAQACDIKFKQEELHGALADAKLAKKIYEVLV